MALSWWCMQSLLRLSLSLYYVSLLSCKVGFSTLLYPVSLLIGYWDWVQGGNPLYAAVKCLSGCRGHIWQKNFIFFAKRTWHTQFLAGKFFSGSKKNFIPPKLAVFWEFRHFPRIEGPFPKFTSFDNLFFAQEIVWKPSVILLLCLSHLWKLWFPFLDPFSVFTTAMIS